MRLIVTITGASGVGKSTLESALADHFGGGRVLTMSTRPARPGETEKDRSFQTSDSLEKRTDLVWKVPIDDNVYAASLAAFEKAFKETGGLAFVAITPERHEIVAKYFRDDFTLAIHLLSPPDTVLRERLWSRPGTSKAEVERRRARSDQEEKLALEISRRFPIHLIVPKSKQGVLDEAIEIISKKLAPN